MIEESDAPLIKTIELIYEAIKVFLVDTYKKITPEFMDMVWESVDVEYLRSLPYPAPFEDQKYVEDE